MCVIWFFCKFTPVSVWWRDWKGVKGKGSNDIAEHPRKVMDLKTLIWPRSQHSSCFEFCCFLIVLIVKHSWLWNKTGVRDTEPPPPDPYHNNKNLSMVFGLPQNLNRIIPWCYLGYWFQDTSTPLRKPINVCDVRPSLSAGSTNQFQGSVKAKFYRPKIFFRKVYMNNVNFYCSSDGCCCWLTKTMK